MNDVTRRFIETYKSLGLTGYKMGKECSVITKQKISNIEKGTTDVTTDILVDFFDNYKTANPTYVLTGVGNVLINTDNEAEYKIIEFDNFPFVSQKAYAGYLSGYADEEYVDSLPTITFPIDHTPMGNYLVFEVKGDSMNDGTSDSYLEGDLLLCREVRMDLWKDSKLHFTKWDFVIVHEEGVVVKRIIDHNIEKHTITIHSLNPDKDKYPDKEIDLCGVRQILNVVNMMRPRKR